MQFEWDPNKNAKNIEKHGFYFEDAWLVLQGNILQYKTEQQNEERWKVIGLLHGLYVALIYTQREDRIRIISIRRARSNEKREHSALYGGTT